MNVRALARRRQAKRLQHAAAARRAFYDRGERACQQYKRTGLARPIDEVFARIDARIEARRRQLTVGRREIQWSVGAELAELTKGGTLTYPPAPEPLPWDHPDVLNPRLHGQLDEPARREGRAGLDHLAAMQWEPPRLELRIKPADLDD